MAALLIARFDGDINELTQAYDRGHALIMSRGGANSFGELRHHCAVGNGALFIVGVWESAEQIRSRWSSDELEELLVSVGSPAPKDRQYHDSRPACGRAAALNRLSDHQSLVGRGGLEPPTSALSARRSAS